MVPSTTIAIINHQPAYASAITVIIAIITQHITVIIAIITQHNHGWLNSEVHALLMHCSSAQKWIPIELESEY